MDNRELDIHQCMTVTVPSVLTASANVRSMALAQLLPYIFVLGAAGGIFGVGTLSSRAGTSKEKNEHAAVNCPKRTQRHRREARTGEADGMPWRYRHGTRTLPLSM